MIPAICCVVRLRLTRFKDKVSYVVHIVDISLLSRSFTLHASVNILKFKFTFIQYIAPSVATYCRDKAVCKLKSYLLKLEMKR